ncbi:hypothetical protein ACFVY1_48020 [Streptomyces sp. NPDC058293]|uniref:hypothetical protein n=1 Tax=Streptomyces sp. NPDC058293 TaxID=3346429 RepID=UPI0036E22E36
MPISGEKLQDRARDTALALPGVSHGRQLDVYKVAGKVFQIGRTTRTNASSPSRQNRSTGGCCNTNTHRSPRAYQPNLGTLK